MTIEIKQGPECTRLAVTSDQHIGNHHRFAGKKLDAGINPRCREHLDAFRRANAMARQLGCGMHVLAGDMFEDEKPRPPIIAATQRVIESSGLPHVILRGNHDMASMARGDNSIAPLAPVATVIEEPTLMQIGAGELWLIPFGARGQVNEWLPGVLREFEEASQHEVRLLIVHFGIAHADTPPWLKRGHNWIEHDEMAPLLRKHGIMVALAGDWHEYHEFPRALQIGALVPNGFSNPGLDLYGSLIVVDLESSIVQREVVPGPRFVKAASVASAALPDDDSTLYLEVTAAPANLVDETRKLEQLRERGVITNGEVKPDKSMIEMDARDAARSARAADSLDEATSAFVDRMALPAEVSRDRVLARVKGFLA